MSKIVLQNQFLFTFIFKIFIKKLKEKSRKIIKKKIEFIECVTNCDFYIIILLVNGC